MTRGYTCRCDGHHRCAVFEMLGHPASARWLNVISEEPRVQCFPEACGFDCFFQCLGLLLCRLMRAVMPPFGFVGEGFLDCGQTAEFEAEFSGCEAFTAYLVLVLREVDDFVAMAAGVGAALGK